MSVIIKLDLAVHSSIDAVTLFFCFISSCSSQDFTGSHDNESNLDFNVVIRNADDSFKLPRSVIIKLTIAYQSANRVELLRQRLDLVNML